MASRQLPRGTGFRGTLTAASAVLLSAAFAMSLAAFVPPTTDDASTASANAPVLLDPGEPTAHTRSLPLRSDAAGLDDVVVNGAVDPVLMRAKLEELAQPLDFHYTVWEHATAIYPGTTPGTGTWGTGEIPYSYPHLDWPLEYNLTMVGTVERQALLDFTAALVVADANLDEVDQGLVLAQMFLQRYLYADQSCDVHLQLLHAYTLGADPVLADVEDVARETIAACPGDPTPHWLVAQLASRLVLARSHSSDESLAVAEEYHAALREQFPQTPLGDAGMADLLMQRADSVTSRGLRPFQARAWNREALALAEQARAGSDDPQLLVVHARALARNGLGDEAWKAMSQLPPTLAATLGASVLSIQLAQTRGDFAGVVELIHAARGPDPLSVQQIDSTRFRGVDGLTAVGALLSDGSYQAIGGSDIADVAFIPAHRGNHQSTGCLDVDLLAALQVTGADLGTWQPRAASLPENLRCLPSSYDPEAYDPDYDDLQDLQRWAGDLVGAQTTIEQWEQAFPNDFAAPQRRGEVAYLAGDHEAAAQYFRQAWQLLETEIDAGGNWRYETRSSIMFDAVQPPVLVNLQLAAALTAAGDRDAAFEALLVAREFWQEPDPTSLQDSERFYVLAQLGAWYLDDGDYENAAIHYLEALTHDRTETGTATVPPAGRDHADDTYIALLRGAQENNLALALSQLERHDEAVTFAEAALSRDTASPLFIDTLAYTLQRVGRLGEAGEQYREVLAADPTAYVSANNLAVVLADDGRLEEAHDVLLGAVRANPDYATGWHNLGVVLARLSPLQLVASERAHAQAVRLDWALRGSGNDLVLDEAIYSSGLDISKALPPDWTFSATASGPDRFTWTMVVLLGLQLARAFGLEQLITSAAQKLSGRPTGRLGGRAWMRAPVGIALTAAAVVLGLGATLGAGSASRAVLYALVATALVVFPWGLRALRGGARIEHYASTPVVGLGVAGLALGLAIAPVPGVRRVPGAQPSRWVLWLPAVVVGAFTLAFAAISLASGSPTARFHTASSAALLGAMMLPFKPFDGVWQRNRLVSLLLAIGLAAVSVALGLYWV